MRGRESTMPHKAEVINKSRDINVFLTNGGSRGGAEKSILVSVVLLLQAATVASHFVLLCLREFS